MSRIFIVSVLVIGLAGPLAAMDLNDPPWDMTLPNQTSQAWECCSSSPLVDIEPTVMDNPYGGPDGPLMNGAFDEIQWILGPEGSDEIATWHVGEPGGVDIWIPNNPDPDLYKLIFWQVTSDKSPTPVGDPPTTNPPSTSVPTGIAHTQWPNSTWYTYNGMLKIVPNPEGETIHFDFLASTNIEEIVIDTVCVPEPATIGLLAMGAVALLRRRRR